MAFVDVEPEPFVAAAPFVKQTSIFQKIGQTFQGIYEGDQEGKYGQNFTFNTAAGRLVLTFKGPNLKYIQKCELKPGDLLAVQLLQLKNIGFDNPAMIYRMKVDRVYKGPPPKNGPNVVIPVYEPASEPDPTNDPFA